MRRILAGITLLLGTYAWGQNVRGTVTESDGRSPIFMANVLVEGSQKGTTTDDAGNFSLQVKPANFPITLRISLIGYATKLIELEGPRKDLEVQLEEDQAMLEEVSVIERRLSEKQQQSALTVEALDATAIKETSANNFYEALGNLKGVDVTSASLGFKIINTRGFNSTSPVRSLQLIDGVDNQAPGLNFALGNFLGASQLDVRSVDVIAGASTAFYGPGAFNGVVDMHTKNPFRYEGLSASLKVGERALTETAVRYAEAFQLGDSKMDNLAFKLNLYFLRANDWEADNLDPIDGSPVGRDNPGRYDAVNRYGDESLASNNERGSFGEVKFNNQPGLGTYYRPGFMERDLVDYDTRNLKSNFGLYYRFQDSVQLSYNINYGTGTTVFQGENRFSLRNIQFVQNTLELSREDKFFVRAYATHENAGDSYDAVLTAFEMNDAMLGNEGTWNSNYARAWKGAPFRFSQAFQDAAGFNVASPDFDSSFYANEYQQILERNNGLLRRFHDSLLGITSPGLLEPGTAAFDSLKQDITNRSFTQGGSQFFDRSALYHFMGEYRFKMPGDIKARVGGNYRMYRPNSRGNIFDERIPNSIVTDSAGNIISQEYRRIRLDEFGAYLGLNRKFYGEILKMSATLRMDKNQNFDYQFSPALSAVYTPEPEHTFRASFGRAIRNPTLQDQYLRYDVGRAVLLGNLDGYEDLVTPESFDYYRSQASLRRSNLDFFDVDPIQPESVFTLEGGYRGSWFDRFYLDMNYYYSWYTNFIGFQFGLDLDFSEDFPNRVTGLNAYRVTANSEAQVTTQGFNLGLNYYLNDHLVANGNYSFNQLNQDQSDNPIVPAFNTPEHKFNLGLSGRRYSFNFDPDNTLSFSTNYKWIQGYRFEGSPQFSGFIDTYGLLDVQLSYHLKAYFTTLKLGASNVLNNEVYQVYGGPRVGRLAYFQLLFEWN